MLGSLEEIAEWAGFCRARSQGAAALHVDTGMNRLGLSLGEGMALGGKPRRAEFLPALLMSHFVSAEETGTRSTAPDRGIRAVREALPDVRASLSNSSGIFLPSGRIRYSCAPGYALYGGNPTPGGPNPMHPVIRLEAASSRSARSSAGETVGYNARWTARATPERLPAVARLRRRLPRAAIREARSRAPSAWVLRPPLPLRRPRVDGPDHRRRDRRAASSR